MGRHGLGTMHENGEIFAHLYALNRLIIGGSVFSLRITHEVTWISPDHRTENQIDRICIGQKFKRSVKDVRVQRGADNSRTQPSIAGQNEDEVEEERDKEEQQNKMQRGFPKG